MARVNNLSNFLTDVASAIKTKKGSETAIPAANFDTEILALPSQGVYQTKVVTVTQNGQTVITPDTGYDAMDGVQVTVNVPEKQLQTKSYNFTTNQTIELLPDSGYDGFDTVTLNINVPSSSGDVKLFETEQAMQADPNPSEGDLAVVYRNEIVIPFPGSTISSITPPTTVVFDTAITSSASLTIRNTSARIYLSCRLTASQFYISDMYGTVITDVSRITYTSSDGITYTRTDSGTNTYDLGAEITISSTANTNILQFLQSGGMVFEGLYEYKHISKGSFRPTLDITKQNILAAVNGDTVANANTNTIYVMNKYTELNSAYAGVFIQNSSLLKVYKDSQGNPVNIRLVTEAIFYDPGRIITVYNNDVYLCDQASYNADDLVAGWNKGYYTLQNDTITFHKATTGSDLQLSIKPGSGNWVNGQILSGQSFILSNISTNSESMLDGYMVLQGAVSIYDVTSSAFTSHSITNNSISVEEWGYVIADTQLTLSQANQLLPDIVGYGPNGVITGNGSIYNDLDFKYYIESLTDSDLLDLQPLVISPIQLSGTSVSLNDKTKDGSNGIVIIKKLQQFGTELALGLHNVTRRVGNNFYVLTRNNSNGQITLYLYDSQGDLIISLAPTLEHNPGYYYLTISDENFYYDNETGYFHHALRSETSLYHIWYDGEFHCVELESNYDGYRYIEMVSYIHNTDRPDYILYHQQDYGIYKYNVNTNETTLITSDYSGVLPGYIGRAYSNGTNIYCLLGDGNLTTSMTLLIMDLDCNILNTQTFSTDLKRFLVKSDSNALYLAEIIIGDTNMANIYSIDDLTTLLDTFYIEWPASRDNYRYFPVEHILLSVQTSYKVLESSTSSSIVRIEPSYTNYWNDTTIYDRAFTVEDGNLVFYAIDYNKRILRGEARMDKIIASGTSNPVIPCHTGNSNNSDYISYFCIGGVN